MVMKNVFTTHSNLAGFMVTASFVSLACVGIGGTALAQQAAADVETRAANVSLAGFDLSTAVGMAAARERLRSAAVRLCSQVADELDLSHHDNFIKCVDTTMASALPKLDQLASKKSPEHGLARNLSR
jgi:UrcA family protein